MLRWVRQTWNEIHAAVSVSTSWTEFVLQAGWSRLSWKYPVYAIDEVFHRLRVLTGDSDQYPSYFWCPTNTGTDSTPPWLRAAMALPYKSSPTVKVHVLDTS